jgi:hypothetical protein
MSNKTVQAKKLLDSYGISSIKPIQLSQAAKQLNKSLSATLRLIAELRSGEQGKGPFHHTKEALRGRHA